MSGNMSFIDNHNSGSGVGATGPASSSLANDASIIRGRRNGTLAQKQSSSSLGRSSLSFSDVGSPSSSFQDGGEQRLAEAYQDKDVWGTRIILSALEEITFSEASYPKLSPEVKHSFQKFLLAVNTAVSNANPFVETANDSSMAGPGQDNSTLVEDNGVPKLHGAALEIPREVMEILEGIPTETKIVLRSIISNYVRSIATKIIETWKPILEAERITLPLSSSKNKSNQGVVKKRASQGGGSISLDDYDLEGCLQLILEKMQSTQKESQELDLKLRELMKARDEQVFKYERDIKMLNQINVAILKEKTAMEDPEFASNYMDILELENKVIEEQLRLEQLQLEVDGSPEEEQREREELYNKLKAIYDKMDAETREMEEKIANYKSLGPEYLRILDEYKTVEDEITTKEWVKEQLVNALKDDCLFNDSL